MIAALKIGHNMCRHASTYPVHPSGSFVQTETLASALYLVLLRLLNRDYVQAAPLISTCHTDQKFSIEERWIMSLINTVQDGSQDKLDAHPDAHACRLMLALVCIQCGENVPWDYAADLDGYIKKNSHISQVCRLSIADERLLMSSAARGGHSGTVFGGGGTSVAHRHAASRIGRRRTRLMPLTCPGWLSMYVLVMSVWPGAIPKM